MENIGIIMNGCTEVGKALSGFHSGRSEQAALKK